MLPRETEITSYNFPEIKAEIHTEDELLERENAVLGIEMRGQTFRAALDPWETERHLRFVISDPDENNHSFQPAETHPPQE